MPLATHARLGRDPEVARRVPLLAEVAPLVAHAAVRNRGTLGGSLAHNDPAAEWPAVALLLGASVTAVGAGGPRTIAAADLFESYLTTTLARRRGAHRGARPGGTAPAPATPSTR